MSIGVHHSGVAFHRRVSVNGLSSSLWSLDEHIRFWTAAGITTAGVPYWRMEAEGCERGAAAQQAQGQAVSSIVAPKPFTSTMMPVGDTPLPWMFEELLVAG
jgi:hypothetical protein